MANRLAVAIIAGLIPLPVLAQEQIPQSFLENLARDLAGLQAEQAPQGPTVRVVKDNANVYAGADETTQIITTLKSGEGAWVIDQAGTWYGVMLPNKEVGWVQTAKVTPASGWPEGAAESAGKPVPTWFQEQILSLLQRAATFREIYHDNPYVIVRGFDISLGLTGPTLGMSFEFKE